MEFTLKALDLINRRGFSDAMVFDDLIDKSGTPDNLDPKQLLAALVSMGGNVDCDEPETSAGATLHEIALYVVVERTLMRQLIGHTLVFSPLASNSVRLAEGWNDDTKVISSVLAGVTVTVSSETVLAATRDILDAYSRVADLTPPPDSIPNLAPA